jgi:scpA/B protein
VDLDALFGDMNLAKLKEIFDGVMRRSDSRMDKQRSKFGTIKRERISLEEKVSSVLKYARRRRNFSFKDLLERQKNKLEVVVTFLAVLELMKVGAICLKQEETFGDMVIESKTEKNTDTDIKEMEDLGISLTGLRESK